jgi:hypothetical protein
MSNPRDPVSIPITETLQTHAKSCEVVLKNFLVAHHAVVTSKVLSYSTVIAISQASSDLRYLVSGTTSISSAVNSIWIKDAKLNLQFWAKYSEMSDADP